MDIKELKKQILNYFKLLGFIKKGNFYYKQNSEIICVVGIQRSAYSSAYYFNLGYVFKALHPTLEYPKDSDGDIRTRFTFKINNNEYDFLPLDLELNEKLLINYIKTNYELLIEFVLENSINEFLNIYPELLFTTTLEAKNYLNLN